MRFAWSSVPGVVGALLVFSMPARSEIIDFESVGRDACYYLIGSEFSTNDYTFVEPLSGSSFFTCNGALDPRPFSTNGTRNLLTRDAIISESSGLSFSLHSFDAGEIIVPYLGAKTIEVIATQVDGTQISVEFELDRFADGPGGLPDFETFSLPTSFSSLMQVELRGSADVFGNRDNFFIDNIDIVRDPALGTAVDIKPGSDPNPINPFSQGMIPVAILGSDSFDATAVDVTTLAFGPDGAAPAHPQGGHFQDVNGDGLTDLLSHYWTQETGIAFGDTEACVTGETLDGTPLEGCDAISTTLECGDGYAAALVVLPLMWIRRRSRRKRS